jgi:uncharacterized protein (TIGR03067 family)
MFSIALLVSLVGPGADTTRAGTQKELAQLQGTWRGVGGEEAGTILTPEEARKEEAEFIFKENTLTIRMHGKVLREFKVAVDPSTDPKELDLRFTQGKDEGKVCLAIYRIDGDRLTICAATKLRPARDERRPNVFSTQKSQGKSKRPGLLLFILERQK